MKLPVLSKFIEESSIKGFLAEDEGEALYRLALLAAPLGPCLEIGSYCGKSTVYIGCACKELDNVLYAVDHHRGSEEHQLGEEYHDADLYDTSNAVMDSFPLFRKTLDLASLNSNVVPIVSSSAVASKRWATPLGMVFVDGGHSHESALHDCTVWSQHVVSGGFLAVHDIFPDPKDGGQGPYLGLQAVLDSGEFRLLEQVNSLGVLQRK